MIKTNEKEIWFIICPACGSNHHDNATDEQINQLDKK
jgi:hypothetical protein